jgi:hypothetical protein
MSDESNDRLRPLNNALAECEPRATLAHLTTETHGSGSSHPTNTHLNHPVFRPAHEDARRGEDDTMAMPE